MDRRSRLGLAALSAPLLLGGALSGCVTQAAGTPISLDDPLGLIEDSEELRLFILPAETHVCLDSATGVIAPSLPDSPVGMTEGAIVDLLLTGGTGAIMQEVSVPPGDYVAYVRGKGTDPVSGVRNTVIAQGCVAIDTLASNESRGVALTVRPVTSEGDCSDAILSPDEQCTTPGMGDCNATCQTTSFQLNTTTDGAQETPRVAGRGANRLITTFGSERVDVLARILGPDGRALTSPALLTMDRNINEALTDSGFGRVPGVPVTAMPAVASNGRFAIAMTSVPRTGEFDVRIGFFDMGMIAEGDVVAPTMDTGRQDAATGAFAADGTYLAAWVDGTAGGVAVRAFASGSRTPSGSGATTIGSGGTAPAVAGLATGFAVAYESASRVMIQRVDGSGAAMGAAIAAAEGGGDQSQPSIAPLSSGGFVVVFRDSSIDGNGTGIRGRVFDASGTGGTAFQVNSSAAGDQSAPWVAAHEDRIAVAFETGGAIHARFFSVNGDAALNREPMQSFDEFEIAPAGTEPTVAAVGSGTSAMWFFAYRTLTDGLGDVFGRRIPR
jgi:hypothetical protein